MKYDERKRVPVFHVPFRPIAKRGLACYWFILINKKYKGDQGLIRHEENHIAVMRNVGLLKYLWKYFVEHWMGDSTFRATSEAAAFRFGSGYGPEQTMYILVKNYNIPADIASEAIQKVYE